MNIVLVGAGRHSRLQHCPSLHKLAREHGGVRLAGVCDLDPGTAQRARSEFGFQRCFTSVTEMLQQVRVDAAVTVLPFSGMAPVFREFLAKRIPMVIEKPLGADLAEAGEIIKLCEGSPVMVSVNRRFDPGLSKAREWLGSLPIRYLAGSMLRHDRTEPEFVWGTGLHLLDAMVSVGGPLKLGEEGGGIVVGPGRARTGRLKGADGLAATFEILPACGRDEEKMRIAGDGYCVDVWTGSPHPWRVEGWRNGAPELNERAADGQPEFIRNGTYNETVAFVDAVAAGRMPEPSPTEVWKATQLADQIQKVSGQ